MSTPSSFSTSELSPPARTAGLASDDAGHAERSSISGKTGDAAIAFLVDLRVLLVTILAVHSSTTLTTLAVGVSTTWRKRGKP